MLGIQRSGAPERDGGGQLCRRARSSDRERAFRCATRTQGPGRSGVRRRPQGASRCRLAFLAGKPMRRKGRQSHPHHTGAGTTAQAAPTPETGPVAEGAVLGPAASGLPRLLSCGSSLA